MVKYKVRFTAQFETEIELPDGHDSGSLTDAVSNINIPENANCRYVSTTFKPGVPQLIPASEIAKMEEYSSEVERLLRHCIEANPNTYQMPTGEGYWEFTRQYIRKLHEWGFRVLDAVAFFLHTEDINPSLTEDEALAKVAELKRKYGVEGQ